MENHVLAQADVLELVATAVDRATPVLQEVEKALDKVQRGAIALDAATRKSLDGVKAYAESFKVAAEAMRELHTRSREATAVLREWQRHGLELAGILNRELGAAFTRVGSSVVSATLSVVAFKNALQESKSLEEFTKSTGFSRDTVVGFTHAMEEFGVPGERAKQMLDGLGTKLQKLRFEGGQSDPMWSKMLGINEMRGAGEEIQAVADQIERGLISQEEGSKKQVALFIKAVGQYRAAYGPQATNEMLDRMGMPREWENATRVPLNELMALVEKFAKQVKDLDPEQVKKFWANWHELSIELSNFTTAVLNPLMPVLNDFLERIATPEVKYFMEEVWPRFAETIKNQFEQLTNFFEGREIDWAKIFNTGMYKAILNDVQDFLNQLYRVWVGTKRSFGLATEEEWEKAREDELKFRVTQRGGTEQEAYELETLTRKRLAPQQDAAEADKHAEELEGVTQRRAAERARRQQERRQQNQNQNQMPQRFSGSDDPNAAKNDFLSDSPMSTNIEDRRGEGGRPLGGVDRSSYDEKTRAVVDLTDELRKLTDAFLRGAVPAGLSGGAVGFSGGGGGNLPDGGVRTGTDPGGGGRDRTGTGSGPRSAGPRGPSPTANIPPQPKPVIPGPYGQPMAPPGTTTTGPADYGGGTGGGVAGGVPAAPGTPGGRALTPEERKQAGGGGGQQQTYNEGNEKQRTAQIVANQLRSQGFSENEIAGMLANVTSESSMDPTLRHPDQPKFSGEAHYAHGLFQEGGDEWNNWVKSMQSRGLDPDKAWKDPQEQARWIGQRLNEPQYAKLREQMRNAKTKEEAAQLFVRGYLKPAQRYQDQRAAEYARGVPSVEHYTGGGKPGDPVPLPTGAAQPAQPQEGDGAGGGISFGTKLFGPNAGKSGSGDMPPDALRDIMEYAGRKTGVNTEIFAGIEAGHHRHQLDRMSGGIGSSDVKLRDPKTGEILDSKKPEDRVKIASYIEAAASAGATGVGHAEDYMTSLGIHIGGGPEAVWGGKGKGANTPKWVREAYERGRARPMTRDQLVAALKEQRIAAKTKVAGPAPTSDTVAPAGPPPTQGLRGTPSGPAVTRPSGARSAPVEDQEERAAGKRPAAIVRPVSSEGKEDTAAGKGGGDAKDTNPNVEIGDVEVEGKQTGGGTHGGKPYVVGEGGPELFMPSGSGMVLPNQMLNHLKGLQVGGKSLGDFFGKGQSPGKMLSSVLGGGSPLTRALHGGGGKEGGDPLSEMMSRLKGGMGGGNPMGMLSGIMGGGGGGPMQMLSGIMGGGNPKQMLSGIMGGGNPLSGLLGFQEGGVIGSKDDLLHGSTYQPGSLRQNTKPQKISATGSLDVNIGPSQYGSIKDREPREGMFETINMNRNLAERHASQITSNQ